jgi:hypothetical protein
MAVEQLQCLLDEANKTIAELEDENDRLHKALQEKDKALLKLKDWADEISRLALLTTSIDADSECLFFRDNAPWNNIMGAHGVPGYKKPKLK